MWLQSIQESIISLMLIIPALTVHEYAHGWMAYRLGDSTAKQSGRLTLNPVAHIDPVGTLILPIVLRLFGMPPFGWAKPVPVNPFWLNNPKRDMMWVALAGPISNVIQGLILTLILKSADHFFRIPSPIMYLLVMGIWINFILAVFNMFPMPPLDGGRVINGLLPSRYAAKYAQIEPYGILILFGLIYFRGGWFFGWLFMPVRYLLVNILKVGHF